MEDEKKKHIDNEKKVDNHAEHENDDGKNVIQVSPEDLDKLLEEIKQKYNLLDEEIKVVKVERRVKSKRQIIFQTIFTYLIDLLIIAAVLGYVRFAKIGFLNVILLSLIFSTIELLTKIIVVRYFPSVMLFSFGLISIPVAMISFILALQIPLGITEIVTSRLILFLVVFLIIRIILTTLLMKRKNDKLFSKIKEGKK